MKATNWKIWNEDTENFEPAVIDQIDASSLNNSIKSVIKQLDNFLDREGIAEKGIEAFDPEKDLAIPYHAFNDDDVMVLMDTTLATIYALAENKNHILHIYAENDELRKELQEAVSAMQKASGFVLEEFFPDEIKKAGGTLSMPQTFNYLWLAYTYANNGEVDPAKTHVVTEAIVTMLATISLVADALEQIK